MLNQSFPEIKDYMANLAQGKGDKSRIPKNVFESPLTPSLKQRPEYNINLQNRFSVPKKLPRDYWTFSVVIHIDNLQFMECYGFIVALELNFAAFHSILNSRGFVLLGSIWRRVYESEVTKHAD